MSDRERRVTVNFHISKEALKMIDDFAHTLRVPRAVVIRAALRVGMSRSTEVREMVEKSR